MAVYVCNTAWCFVKPYGLQGGLPRRYASRYDARSAGNDYIKAVAVHGLPRYARNDMMLFTTQSNFFYHYPLLLAEHI